jgi:hypothetical protein
MSLVDEFVSKLHPKDQKRALESITILEDIFGILKSRGYLRESLRESPERAKFVNIMKDSNRLSASYIMLFQILERERLSKKFTEHNKEFGFDEEGVAYLILSESIATVLRTSEMFKNCFLFALKTEGKPFSSQATLGTLFRKLEKITKNKSDYFAKEFDVDLRNALAHGLFWMQDGILVYCEDITLRKPKEIPLSELWIKAKDQSITLQCLINFVGDYYVGT